MGKQSRRKKKGNAKQDVAGGKHGRHQEPRQQRPQGQQTHQAPEHFDLPVEDTYPVHALVLFQTIRNAGANRMPAAKNEEPCPEGMTLLTKSGPFAFPWQRFLNQLGKDVEVQDATRRLRFTMPMPEDLYAASHPLFNELLIEGGPALREILDTAAASTPVTAEPTAAAWAERIRTMSTDERFKMMRLIRLSISHAQVKQWTAEQIYKRKERELAPKTAIPAPEAAKLLQFLAGQKELPASLSRAIEREAEFWQVVFARVYFFIDMQPLQPVAEYLPCPTPPIRVPPLKEGEGDDFAGPLRQAADDRDDEDEDDEDENIPVLEGLVPLRANDLRRNNSRTEEYDENFGLLGVFIPQGPGFDESTGCLAYGLITEPDACSIRFVVCDAPTRKNKERAAYAFYASADEKRRAEQRIPAQEAPADDDLTHWTLDATKTRQDARQSNLFIGRAKHTVVQGERIGHILKIKRFRKTLKFD